MRRIAVLLSAAILAACGGDGDSELSATDVYRAHAVNACEDALDLTATPPSRSDSPATLTDMGEALRGTADDLRDQALPEADRQVGQALLAALDELAAVYDDFAAAVADRDEGAFEAALRSRAVAYAGVTRACTDLGYGRPQ